MHDRILNILELTRNNALSKEDILKKLGDPNVSMELLNEEIKELIDEKKVYCVNSKLGLYTLNPFVDGIFHVLRNGNCYVYADGKEIKINPERTYGALEGDKVRVRITDFNTLEGSIKEIIERHGIIAELKTINGKRYAVVGNDKYMIDVDSHIVDNTLIGIKIDKTKAGKFYHASLDRVIGHKNAPKIDEDKILYEHDFEVNFSDKTMEEVESIPSSVLDSEINSRSEHDLRNKMIFTIDGDDTKDIDDAVSLDILDNGNYLLGVHIADVSHYVKISSAIDNDAYLRATSVYMPGVVSPMYPQFLSNGICSLNPNVDRLAITCQMEIDENGNLIDFDIFKSVINSNIQMTYKNVNMILDKNIVPDGYEKYSEKLKQMNKLKDILSASRKKRGMLDFDSGELKIEVDDKGNVLNITKRVQGTGENLIENFMLAANECVATYIYNMGIPSIYRDHDYPSFERLKKVLTVIKSYGEDVNIKLNINDPLVLQKILKELKKSKNFDIYSSMLLRCMAKAEYKTNNYGHFGIGVNASKNEAYTHFTSPIRRYPDTTIHRILTMILNGDFDTLYSDNFKKYLDDVAKQSSLKELDADACEREADKMKMALYMNDYINKEFEGRIVGFTMHGMFVELDNLVEGRVAYSTMDDFYRYNEDLEILVGDRKKKVYRLGDKVKVVVVRASKDDREIDFELVKSGEGNGNHKQRSKI